MENFKYSRYLIRRKVFRLFGAAFHIYDEQGGLQFFVNQKGFKLKEDIRVFTSESMTEELLLITARNIIDFSATYDVIDSKTGVRLGSLQRKGFKSMFKDEWVIQDINDFNVGSIKEDSMLLALLRRFLTSLIPQTFLGTINDMQIFTFSQKFNPFIQKIDLDFTCDTHNKLDRRMGIAAAVLICSIEGKQN